MSAPPAKPVPHTKPAPHIKPAQHTKPAPAPGGAQPTSRRGFFEKLVTAGFGAGAATVLTGFAPQGNGGAGKSGGGMHGPVRPATEVLTMPPAAWARDLIAPYGDGRPLSAQWAVAYVAQGPQQQLIFVVVDLETGGHAELGLWARNRSPRGERPVTGSRRYDLHLHGGGDVPAHLVRVAERLAGVIGRHERRVSPPTPVPQRP